MLNGRRTPSGLPIEHAQCVVRQVRAAVSNLLAALYRRRSPMPMIGISAARFVRKTLSAATDFQVMAGASDERAAQARAHRARRGIADVARSMSRRIPP
ncbi:MAG TPA: hypothetical protein VLF18_18110 [Tahibacter sp.]|uniref:hypothetical protein n=1 Tax=Tahibacter sp. TaxID=2056211 RepID=UPI002C93EC11|nr:hypothetical protein [Tahibacter sp.]HSX62101.1 hypothetical protein [Tahibacter sp.]